MSRRDQIRMSDDEVRAYFAEQRVINVATMNPNGRPHLAPLWYFPRDSDSGVRDSGTRDSGENDGVPALVTWTYRKSQKIANLQRLPQATVLIESGESYEQLRGVSMECDVAFVEDAGETAEIGTALAMRYAGLEGEPPDELKAGISQQAPKRVGLVFTPTKIVSWDHAKLGGAY
ncbi:MULTISPECIES: pyridoxamine 5'-phosphate oxidase family protein [Prauserella salsuginis group]|uniref:Pyridoxamine 5'-phosphate oxidase family protein n=1 Tax=Prauserella salsuginis TaxID=387889 RepID=A0ABW6G0J4_9PSEU|nr:MULTISPECIES: pyridoxamine 5'-phosphate oxidase family protein [Prauserella salsuginis group]MCR3721320.1 Pyridoxamine 5'-phosphate oxidase [Prauserella flava]MCR3734600.1 Pyridoxamine 5'-phosphate oxidase [Prauserella salsuginis]